MGLLRILIWIWRSRLLRRALWLVLRFIGWRRVVRAALRLRRTRRRLVGSRLTHAR